MRKLLLALIGMVMLLSIHGLAHADGYAWQKTKWGMFKEEVEKACGFSLGEGHTSEDEHRYSKGNLKIGSHIYNVVFTFKNDRLSRINLHCQVKTKEGALSSFDEAKVALDERFGQHTGNSEKVVPEHGLLQQFKWRDTNMLISLHMITKNDGSNVVFVQYDVISMPGVKGF